MLVTSLERVDDTEDLSSIASSGGRVGQDSADSLLGVDDKDGADSESNTLAVHVGGILVVQHVVCVCDLPLLVTNDGKLQAAAANLVDILDPSSVALDSVGRKANELDTTLGELWLELSEGAELGGADRGVVLRVREQNNPLVANELVEVDWAAGGLCLEVGSSATQTEGLGSLVGRHVDRM